MTPEQRQRRAEREARAAERAVGYRAATDATMQRIREHAAAMTAAGIVHGCTTCGRTFTAAEFDALPVDHETDRWTVRLCPCAAPWPYGRMAMPRFALTPGD